MADTQLKIQLLSHCIIDFPRRDDARVPLFQAAVAAQSNEYAIGIMEPLFQTQFLRNYEPEAANDEQQIVSSGDEEEESDDSNAPVSAAMKLSRAQEAQVAQMIGDVMSRLNRLTEAVSYYDTARRMEDSAAIRKALLRKIADAKSTLRIEHQNAMRQPLLHEALEQDRVVRPRLMARVTPVPKMANAKGGVKQ